MSEVTVFEDAQVAYEGYRDHTGGISLASGQAIPEWGALRPDIQAAWCASAHALREIMFCPPHWHVEHTAAMEPFVQCIACTREEVRELRQRRDFLLESNNRLVEERRAAEAQAEGLRAVLEVRQLKCIFCAFSGTLAELQVHSAECITHPAVKRLHLARQHWFEAQGRLEKAEKALIEANGGHECGSMDSIQILQKSIDAVRREAGAKALRDWANGWEIHNDKGAEFIKRKMLQHADHLAGCTEPSLAALEKELKALMETYPVWGMGGGSQMEMKAQDLWEREHGEKARQLRAAIVSATLPAATADSEPSHE